MDMLALTRNVLKHGLTLINFFNRVCQLIVTMASTLHTFVIMVQKTSHAL